MKRTLQLITFAFATLLLAACAGNRGVYDDNRDSRTSAGNYGYVDDVRRVSLDDNSIGLGAVIGAVAGAAVGSQIGSGSGKDVATAGGAVAGGVAGHEIQKRQRGDRLAYQFVVELDDGRTARVTQTESYGIDRGDRVVLDDEKVFPVTG